MKLKNSPRGQVAALAVLLAALFALPFFNGAAGPGGEIAVMLAAFLLFVLAYIFQKRRFLPKIGDAFLPFLFFAFLATLQSSDWSISVSKFLLWLGYYFWFLAAAWLANKKNLRFLVYTLLAVGFLLSLWSFYYFLPNSHPPANLMNLVYADYGHNHLADYLSLTFPLGLALFLQSTHRWLWLFLTIFYFVALLLTFSRASFLFTPLVVVLLLKVSKVKDKKTRLFTWALALIPLLVLAAIFAFSFLPKHAQWAIAVNLPPRLVRQIVKPWGQEERLYYWQAAWRAFWHRPLLGWGPGTFGLSSRRYQVRPLAWAQYAHNFYFQLLAETGILGFLAFGLFLVFAGRQIWRHLNRRSPYQLGSFFALLLSALHSTLDFDWEFPAVFLAFLTLLAFLVPKKKRFRRAGLLLALAYFLLIQSRIWGWIYFQDGNYHRSQAIYPFSRPVWLAEARRATKLGVLKKALQFNRGDAEFWMLLGKYFEKTKAWPQAEMAFQKAMELDPANVLAFHHLERIYQRQGRQDAKVQLWEKTARHFYNLSADDPLHLFYAKVYYQLGLFYYRKGQVEKTEKYWQQAVQLAPQWSYFYLDLANFYAARGQKKQAKEVLQACLRFYNPRITCQNFLLSKHWQKPGSWRAKIGEIPDY